MSNDHTDSGEVASIDRTAYGTAPRVTPEAIEAFITSEHYFTAHQGARASFLDDAVENGGNPLQVLELPAPLKLLTFCVLVLKNGFTVHGVSACASPANFSQEIGNRVARQNAVNQIWPLLGFKLVDDLHKIRMFGDEDHDQDALGEAMTRLLAHTLGNPDALRITDAELLLHKLEEPVVTCGVKTDFQVALEK